MEGGKVKISVTGEKAKGNISIQKVKEDEREKEVTIHRINDVEKP